MTVKHILNIKSILKAPSLHKDFIFKLLYSKNFIHACMCTMHDDTNNKNNNKRPEKRAIKTLDAITF